uniref:Uncharacterized protein n=1 Tax=viral metagenome TaxID=1070528 RepID=A0A6M3KEH7_9ZZZZ
MSRNDLINIEIEILEPARKDLNLRGNVGKIIRSKNAPMAYRCFEPDLEHIKTLLEACIFYDTKEHLFVFEKDKSFEELVRRNLITVDAGIFFNLGYGMAYGEGIIKKGF